MNELFLFILTTYLIAGLLQGIIISIYENWYDGCTAPGEQILYYIFIAYAWPILLTFELIEWYQKKEHC